MKTSNVKGMSFGFSAVHAGQRNVSVAPQLIVVSTEGGFRMTPQVSRALGIGHGDYAMFFNNINKIEQAITAKNEILVDFCEAQGLEFGSPESKIAIHKEFDMWAVAKGVIEYDAKGNQKTTTERLSKNDKIKFATQNFETMFEAAMTQADDETKDALSREGITKEEQVEILATFVTPRELPKYSGSKVANTAGLTGAGTAVNFTDNNVWKQLKADLKEDATKLNRVYELDVENLQELAYDNGFEVVTVKALILGEYTDKEPSRIGAKSEE